ncbi:MAG TPA: YncE family protein [Gemmatimonadaceae bacterium]|nr:YncE family protein [Gemmatimonadaceae bacterium]
MRNRAISSSLILLLLLFTACKDSTSPKPSQFTHPQGIVSTQISGLGGRPFGIGVTSTGDVLVTEQDLNRAVHVGAAGSPMTNIPVGADPGDVVANRAATQAIVSGFNDGTLSFINLANNTVTQSIHMPSANAYRLAFSPDETVLYVTTTDGHIYAVNPSAHTVGTTKQYAGSLQGLAVDHAGHAVFISSTAGVISRLDPASLASTATAAVSCNAQDIAVSANDSELYVACENGAVVVLNASTLAAKNTIVVPSGGPFGLAVTPDNAQLYVTSPTTGRLTIIDVASGSVIKTLIVTGTPRRVAFSASGDKAYVANEGNWIDVIQ